MRHVAPKPVRKLLRRLANGKPVQSVDLQMVHARVLDKPVTFCVNMERDPIQRNHRAGTFYELKELLALQAIFPHGGCFVDIGANVGNHSLFAAQHLGAAKVIPFEPNPRAYDLLVQNVLVNGLSKVIDLQFLGVGLSDAHSGGFAMEKRDRNLGGARMLEGEGDLDVYRADEVLADVTPDMIKIDVEEMEMQVLAGLSGVLDRCRPVLLVEVDTVNEDAFQSWIAENDYAMVSSYQRYKTNRNHIVADRHSAERLTAQLAEPAKGAA